MDCTGLGWTGLEWDGMDEWNDMEWMNEGVNERATAKVVSYYSAPSFVSCGCSSCCVWVAVMVRCGTCCSAWISVETQALAVAFECAKLNQLLQHSAFIKSTLFCS